MPANVRTVSDLLAWKEVPATGVAVAVNDKVVRKSQWEETPLMQGDRILVITAVCGG
ncbi:MAG: sulfur carrier protein ThiS [Muribaculaceae bacterium]|nr:sulfur carrier protein ThiS [Muribaculaceae bacterium]